MMICRSRVEVALVRPGIVGSTENDASVKLNEERLAHFKFASLNKAKGNESPSAGTIEFHSFF